MYWEPGEFWESGERALSGDDVEWRLLAADRLCEGSRALLEALCVLGGEQPLAMVARVAAVPAPVRAVSLLLGLGLVVSAGGGQQPDTVALARDGDGLLVRARLTPTRWRALHLAAAEALGPRAALVHRAVAADRPDRDLAAALEEEALDGRAPDDEIGVPTRQLLMWAANLSPDHGERERRVLLAAMHDVYHEEIGADDLWTRVEELPPSSLRHCAMAGRAMAEQRLGATAGHLHAARRTLAAENASPDGASPARWHGERARSAAAAIETVAAALACRTARGEAAVEAATLALDAADRDAVRARTARRLLLTGRSYTGGPREVLGSPELRDPALSLLRGECRLLAGDLAAGVRDLDGLVRSHGAHSGHPDRLRALERLAVAHFLLGNWQEADSAVNCLGEADADTTGRGLRAMLSAWRGAGAAPRRADRAALNGMAAGSAEPDRVVIAACADALAMLAYRRHTDILAALARLTADSTGLADAPAKFAPLWLPVYVEAAVETASETGLADLRACAEQVPYLMLTYHRLAGRAAEHRGDPAAAQEAYEAGLQAAETCADVPPLHRAQLDYAYGRLLCGLGRTAAGLDRLQQAQDGFASLGALAFVRGCTQARAVVTREASRCPDTALTEREATVARLVASGLTNRQVAERLLISAKAVEYHLRKIYRKLGVRTRTELASTWQA